MVKANVFILMGLFVGQNLADDWILESHSMWNPKAYPVLGNGHIGFTVFDTSIYLNGLYNGKMNKTHRARIENHANLQLVDCNTQNKVPKPECVYKMNLKTGSFEVVYNNEAYKLTHTVFPHRYYTRTIVNKFTLERGNAKGPIRVNVTSDPGSIGMDLTFPTFAQYRRGSYNFTCESGYTLEVENKKMQNDVEPLTFCFSSLNTLVLPEKRNLMDFYAFMIVDQDETVVRSEMDKIVTESQVVNRHNEMWQEFWDSFDIEMESRLELTQLTRSAIYYLVSNLPSPHTYQASRPFYGVSSSGLGRVDSQTKGRISWDQEMFMQLPLLLMNPTWSADLLDYRYRVHATDELSGGWTYFWETAFTGNHLDTYHEMMRATHVPADVAFAVRQHLSATHDIKWFQRYGCDLALNTAAYWAKRADYNMTSDLYDLHGIGSESSFDDPMPNNAFVNVAAGMNMYLGDFAACVCDRPTRQSFASIARSLTLPLDKKDELVKVHSDYETYLRTRGADAMLTIYPLQYNLDPKVKNNTLAHYRKATLGLIPPTTWSLHVIGDLETGQQQLETSIFHHLVTGYNLKPFYVWTDQSNLGLGAIYNFISGGAAYLQVLMNGYGGIRLFFDRMEIRSPSLPPDAKSLKIKGVTYLGAKFSIQIQEANFTLTLLEKSSKHKVMAQVDNKNFPFDSTGETLTAKRLETVILRNQNYAYGECKMPENVIGIPRTERTLKEQNPGIPRTESAIKEQDPQNVPMFNLGQRCENLPYLAVLACIIVGIVSILAGISFIIYLLLLIVARLNTKNPDIPFKTMIDSI